MERLRNFRALMGEGPKDQLTDEEYVEYLANSNSFCGRLWANLNSDDNGEDDPSLTSLFSMCSGEYESLTDVTDDLNESTTASAANTSTTVSVSSIDDLQFNDTDFGDIDILSSTFIIDEDMSAFSQDEFFDLLDSGDDDYEKKVIIEDHVQMAKLRPTTNPSA